MQCADDDEMAALVGEHSLQRRNPRAVALRHERLVKPRELVELIEQLGAQALELSVAPCGDHVAEHRGPLVELGQRLLEQRLLLLWRKRVEQTELELERLEADDFLAG